MADNRRVVYAELHDVVFLPGVGQLPKSFDVSPQSQNAKLRGLKMWAGTYGVEVDLKGRTGFLPYGNVKWVVFESQAEADARSAKEAGKTFSVAAKAG